LVGGADLVASAVVQAAIGISSDRQLRGLIGPHPHGMVPASARAVAVHRRSRTLVESISIVQQRLVCWLELGGLRRGDGPQLALQSSPGLGGLDFA
jgi:hypothetical protein